MRFAVKRWVVLVRENAQEICLKSTENKGLVDDARAIIRAFFRLICLVALRKVSLRGVGSSSRED